MTVPASNAVVIFMIASHVCRAITMAGCRVHSTAIPRNKIAASASIGGEAVVSDIELAWLRECQQTGRFPLRKWHRYGPNDHFGRGLKPASLLQHEILADVRVGQKQTCAAQKRHVRFTPESGHRTGSQARRRPPPPAGRGAKLSNPEWRHRATRGGVHFTQGPLFYMLRNRFYIGEVLYKGEICPGPQPPLIERELFDAVQAQLTEQRSHYVTTRTKSDAPLQGHSVR